MATCRFSASTFGNTLTISITKTAVRITSKRGGTWSIGTLWPRITNLFSVAAVCDRRIILPTLIERRYSGLPKRKLSQASGRLSFSRDRAAGARVLREESGRGEAFDSLRHRRCDRAV